MSDAATGSAGLGRRDAAETPPWFHEAMRTLVGLAYESRDSEWRDAVVQETAKAVPGRWWWDLGTSWDTATCDDLESIAQVLEGLGPTFSRVAGEVAEALARSVGLPDSVATPIGWVVGGLAPVPFENQMRLAAVAVRALGIGICAQGHEAAPGELDLDSCACFRALTTDEIDEWVGSVLRVVVSVSLGITPEEQLRQTFDEPALTPLIPPPSRATGLRHDAVRHRGQGLGMGFDL